jgi:cytochrome c biogenesis protein
MTLSTEGINVRSGPRVVRGAVELLSSMRFSISLLSVICIASVIGTVLKQNEPSTNYVNQFGPFWSEVFRAASLTNVYSAWWFLLILAFLVASTSLCIARNLPKIAADWNAFKEGMREQSLDAFGLRARRQRIGAPQVLAPALAKALVDRGWRVKVQQREAGWMIAAKAGAANKVGYLAAHGAIVLICVGGLLDGDLMVRAQMLLGGKTPYLGGGMLADVNSRHRLDDSNPTFRGNLLVAEGASADTAILNVADGILLQELPFTVELKKFIVEYYSTGMPKLFASEITITDKATGQARDTRVEVNQPANHKGIHIYQSSFDDGGSTVHLKAIPLLAQNKPFEIQGVIGATTSLRAGDAADQALTLEYTGLRVINVENMGAGEGSGTDLRKVDLGASINQRFGAGNKTLERKTLRNVGPSISYKLRDASGQAREFHNYMLPVDTGDGAPVFLLGVRETPSEPFRYLRIPVDAEGLIDGFVQLRGMLLNQERRNLAVLRYATKAVDPARPELRDQLTVSAQRAMDLFAGADAVAAANGAAGLKDAGLQAVSRFLETNVPASERERAGEVLVRIIHGALFELNQMSRQQAGLAPLEYSDKAQDFLNRAVLALSDMQFYPAPLLFQLTDFKQVQASVFQVARAPGQAIVYLGCALLILGIFAMLYIRDRRLWVWISPLPQEPGDTHVPPSSQVRMGMSSNRKTFDTDREFAALKALLLEAT